MIMPPNSTSPPPSSSSSSSHRLTRSRSSLSHSQPPPPPFNLRSIDPKIWRACAGNSVAIPTLNSRVYYFPQGHLEHSTASAAAGSVQLSRLLLSRPSILCRIAGVQFLADPTTDEVFAKVLLHPIHPGYDLTSTAADEGGGADGDGGDRVVAFAKILTPSDANNGGGFSVPRFCADSIFPPLNYQAEPPVQNISVTDLHGVAWDFRHIYRGTPRRHLLTTGWSKFVNHKMLVAGDSVVFTRNSGGEMYIGVRRTVRASHGGGGGYGRWSAHIGGLKSSPDEEGNAGGGGGGGGGEGFKARLSVEAVAEAAEMGAQNMPFEVVYYPKGGWSEFVVKAEVVERAMSGFWTRGMRVKMAMETDDSSRMTWFQGTLSSVSYSDNMPWPRSPWRMLQVTWDEPELLQNHKWVSPWQVDFASSTPSLHTLPSLHTAPPLHTLPSYHSVPSLLTPSSLHTLPSPHTPSSLHTAPFLHTVPPTKRFRAPPNLGLLRKGEEGFMIPMTRGANSTMGHFDASTLNYTNFPAGMQGARQDLFCVSNVAHLLHENTPQMCTNNSFGNNMEPRLKRVSTELNIGSPQSDHLSPESQSSPHSFGVELDGNQYCNSTKTGKSSFQLFGKIIHMEEPIESNKAVGCIVAGGNIGNNETELLNNQLDLSYTKLLQRIDVRVSAVEACTW